MSTKEPITPDKFAAEMRELAEFARKNQELRAEVERLKVENKRLLNECIRAAGEGIKTAHSLIPVCWVFRPIVDRYRRMMTRQLQQAREEGATDFGEWLVTHGDLADKATRSWVREMVRDWNEWRKQKEGGE